MPVKPGLAAVEGVAESGVPGCQADAVSPGPRLLRAFSRSAGEKGQGTAKRTILAQTRHGASHALS